MPNHRKELRFGFEKIILKSEQDTKTFLGNESSTDEHEKLRCVRSRRCTGAVGTISQMNRAAKIICLGLYGTPGSGKSTASQMIVDYCTQRSIPVVRIKLADPLYEAQSSIYKIADKKLHDFYEQDGELLNFLGYYLRKLNPNALLDRFSTRLSEGTEKLIESRPSFCIVVCDDMRRPDADFLKSKGFIFVRIVAEAQLCEKRRGERGDRSLGTSTHSTEQGLDEITPDHIIENNATVDDLQRQVTALIDGLHHDFDRKKNTP